MIINQHPLWCQQKVPKIQLENQEIVKNYLHELHISDASNEAFISNLQSS